MKQRQGFRYLNLKQVPNGLELSLNKEGRKEVKDLKESHPDWNDDQIISDLFDDVQGNSEYMFHPDGGSMGFGLTEAPMVTDGYYYDDDGKFTDKGHSDSHVFYFDNYMIKSPLDVMLEDKKVFFTEIKSEGGTIKGKKYIYIDAEKDEMPEKVEYYFNEYPHKKFFDGKDFLFDYMVIEQGGKTYVISGNYKEMMKRKSKLNYSIDQSPDSLEWKGGYNTMQDGGEIDPPAGMTVEAILAYNDVVDGISEGEFFKKHAVGDYQQYKEIADEKKVKYKLPTNWFVEEETGEVEVDTPKDVTKRYIYSHHEERGEFSASVRDFDDKYVWEYTYPDSEVPIEEQSSIFDDGFMKNDEDIAGLEKYLKSLNTIEQDSEIITQEDYEKNYMNKGGVTPETTPVSTEPTVKVMTFEEFVLNRPKQVRGKVWSDGKWVERTYYYGYSRWVDRFGWFNRNKGKKITDEVAYMLYQKEQEAGKMANGGGVKETNDDILFMLNLDCRQGYFAPDLKKMGFDFGEAMTNERWQFRTENFELYRNNFFDLRFFVSPIKKKTND